MYNKKSDYAKLHLRFAVGPKPNVRKMTVTTVRHDIPLDLVTPSGVVDKISVYNFIFLPCTIIEIHDNAIKIIIFISAL